MPLSRPINNAHPAASDFFENLIIAQPPIGVVHINFAQQVIQRLSVLAIRRFDLLPSAFPQAGLERADSSGKVPALDARSRSAPRTGDRFLLHDALKA